VKSYCITFDIAEFEEGLERTNMELAPGRTRFRDIKSAGKDFTIDVDGFEVNGTSRKDPRGGGLFLSNRILP
jgi:hypothetical protein